MNSIDLTRSPVDLLVGLINTNNNISLQNTNLKFRNLIAIPNPVAEQVDVNGTAVTITRDTSVQVDVLTDEVTDNFVTFKYERINLTKLFSACDPTILETSVAIGDDGLPTSPDDFNAEVLRKFKVTFDTEYFNLSAQPTAVRVAAKATNLAYTGHVDIKYVPVLRKQIPTMLLDGFSLKNDINLSEVTIRKILIPKAPDRGGRGIAELMVPHTITGPDALKLAATTTDNLLPLYEVIRPRYTRPIFWSLDKVGGYSLLGATVISNDNGLLVVSLSEENCTRLYGNLRINYKE